MGKPGTIVSSDLAFDESQRWCCSRYVKRSIRSCVSRRVNDTSVEVTKNRNLEGKEQRREEKRY